LLPKVAVADPWHQLIFVCYEHCGPHQRRSCAPPTKESSIQQVWQTDDAAGAAACTVPMRSSWHVNRNSSRVCTPGCTRIGQVFSPQHVLFCTIQYYNAIQYNTIQYKMNTLSLLLLLCMSLERNIPTEAADTSTVAMLSACLELSCMCAPLRHPQGMRPTLL
jgi:hypothetical protein